MILNANLQLGLLKENLLPLNSKILIFSLYVGTFIGAGTILLRSTKQISNIQGSKAKISSVSVFVVYMILSAILIITIVSMFQFNKYSELVFYLTSYLTFILSLVFLSILSLKFFILFSIRKNYLTLFYGVLFSIYCCSLILLFLYLINGLATHPSEIKPVPPRELVAGKYLVNVFFQANLAKLYDILFLVSFTLAWILSVVLLKQYRHRIGRYGFWLLSIIPLFFLLSRFGELFFLSHNLFNSGTANRIPLSVGEALLNSVINSDIQMSGVFFGYPFLIIALKLKNYELRNLMIVTVIGIMLLFGSRDLSSIFVSSFPPGGVVTISFMSIASYMLLTSIVSLLRLAMRDKQLFGELVRKVETDNALMKNLVLSEKKILTLKMVKPLIDYSIQWQKDHSYNDLSLQEVKEIIQDVASELRQKKSNT